MPLEAVNVDIVDRRYDVLECACKFAVWTDRYDVAEYGAAGRPKMPKLNLSNQPLYDVALHPHALYRYFMCKYAD